MANSWWQAEMGEQRWWHSLLRAVVARGDVPRHVAFVMDGNRRFARSHLLGSVLEGHECGFRQLTSILRWCRDLGVDEVTVYAFSLENFKRSPEEVDGLMKLAEEKFGQLVDEQLGEVLIEQIDFREKLIAEQICFRFFGDLTRLAPRLRQLIARLELDTNHFTRGFVNVCMAYTAQDEMRRAMVAIAEGVGQGLLVEEDVDEQLINHCLDSRRSPQPDLLIRTSGEKRFSDFLLWQCCTCHVHYEDVLWPEFDYWHLCKAMFAYQRNRSSVEAIVRLCTVEEDERCEVNEVDNNQRNRSSVEAIVRLCTAEEDERCDNRRIKFLNWLEERHLDQLRLCLSDVDVVE